MASVTMDGVGVHFDFVDIWENTPKFACKLEYANKK